MQISQVIEKEIKVPISKLQYTKLLNYFKNKEKNLQINYYYFNQNISDEITIRIRRKDNRLLLQIKYPVENDSSNYGAAHIRKEVEKQVYDIPHSISKEEIFELTGLLVEDAYLIGELKTLRYEVSVEDSLLCIDYNEYLNVFDYELEIEYQEAVSKELLPLLDSYNINITKLSCGKFARFLQQYALSAKN